MPCDFADLIILQIDFILLKVSATKSSKTDIWTFLIDKITLLFEINKVISVFIEYRIIKFWTTAFDDHINIIWWDYKIIYWRFSEIAVSQLSNCYAILEILKRRKTIVCILVTYESADEKCAFKNIKKTTTTNWEMEIIDWNVLVLIEETTLLLRSTNCSLMTIYWIKWTFDCSVMTNMNIFWWINKYKKIICWT